MGTFSIWHWLIVLAVVVLVFGTKKLRNLGSDLGSALKGFKEGMKESGTENTSFQSTHINDPVKEVEAKNDSPANAFKENIQEEQHTPINAPVPPIPANKTATENSASQPTSVNNQITDVKTREEPPAKA